MKKIVLLLSLVFIVTIVLIYYKPLDYSRIPWMLLDDLSLAEFNKIPPEYFLDIPVEKIALLSPETLALTNQMQFENLQNLLSADQLVKLDQKHIQWINLDTLIQLNDHELKMLSANFFGRLSMDQIRKFEDLMQDYHVFSLPKKLLTGITLGRLESFPDEDILTLPESVLLNLNQDQFEVLESVLSNSQVMNLSEEVIKFLSEDRLAELDPLEIIKLDSLFLKALSRNQLEVIYDFLSDEQLLYLNFQKSEINREV